MYYCNFYLLLLLLLLFGASVLAPSSSRVDPPHSPSASPYCNNGLFSDLCRPLPRFRVVKRIPNGSKETVRQRFPTILDHVVANNTLTSWDSFLFCSLLSSPTS